MAVTKLVCFTNLEQMQKWTKNTRKLQQVQVDQLYALFKEAKDFLQVECSMHPGPGFCLNPVLDSPEYVDKIGCSKCRKRKVLMGLDKKLNEFRVIPGWENFGQ